MLTAIPPVIRTARVKLPPEAAFRAFTEQLGRWWPLETHSMATDQGTETKAVDVMFEPLKGGRVFEVMANGQRGDWATVLDWDPPSRFILAWQPNPSRPAATDLEVRFAQSGDGTEVVLEHRGWERFGENGLESRNDYDAGWIPVLERFVQHVGS